MRLVFATNNQHKLSEIRDLAPKGIEILSLSDIDCNEDLIEDHNTLEGNAIQKAKYVFENYGFNCFSDDTGLEINALGGAPGVYSARYAGPDCNAKDNIVKILKELNGVENRNAKFRTVIALFINQESFLFEGECRGHIKLKPTGIKGFGYDPIFQPNEYSITFAQMTKLEKGKISHRGKAVRELVQFLESSC